MSRSCAAGCRRASTGPRRAGGCAARSTSGRRRPPPIWTAIRGDVVPEPMAGVRHRAPESAPRIDALIVSEAQQERLRHVARLLETGRVRTLVLRGMAGSERLDLVAALAAATG